MQCSKCGRTLIRVDNPMRVEYRHPRGTECDIGEYADPAMMMEPLPTTADTPVIDIHGTTSDGRHVEGEEAARVLSTEITRWADAAMFRAASMPTGDDGRVTPRVTLLNATPDPLGSLAALYAMYSGRVVRSLAEVTDDDRRAAFEDQFKTELQGPLECVTFHFLIEGVTRSFTHQMVRTRDAFFAQESMRFAVVEGQPWTERAALPASIPDDPSDDRWAAWATAIETAEWNYLHLIDAGIPAEDARGLMPHAMTTRLHMVTNLRTLLHVAGLRLCTQAEFPWRAVMAQVVLALRMYQGPKYLCKEPVEGVALGWTDVGWQFNAIADKLQPVCYQKGRCGFMAKFDRGCTIRARVDANARIGRPSSEWDQPYHDTASNSIYIDGIRPSEWAADPTAARRGDGEKRKPGDEWLNKWRHQKDGAVCNAGFLAPVPYPRGGGSWWCTEHGEPLYPDLDEPVKG